MNTTNPHPKFSIVVPLFNKEAVVLTTLQSVIQQTYKNFELIVVDDGSSDQSVKRIQSHISDQRIHIISQHNQGVSAARNNGVHHASGEWVCFLDADDWWHPNHLELLANAISKYKTIEFFATAFIPQADKADWQPQTWPIPEKFGFNQINDLPLQWMQSIPFYTSSVCIRTKLLKQSAPCFVVGESFGEDLDLWFRLAETTPILQIDTPTVVYRTEQADSLTSGATHLRIPYVVKNLRSRLKNSQIPPNLCNSSQQYIDHELISLARTAIATRQRGLALKLLTEAYRSFLSKRWWLTLFMTLFFSGNAVKSWQNKRSGRQEALQ